MNAKKSADYCNLIENVKNKYRKNPIYAKNMTLGWCDLRRGEDLCQEINIWTYWQGIHRRIKILSDILNCLEKKK